MYGLGGTLGRHVVSSSCSVTGPCMVVRQEGLFEGVQPRRERRTGSCGGTPTGGAMDGIGGMPGGIG